MPALIQVCIAVATVALVVATVALVRLLTQARATAAQVERTMAHFDATLPTLEKAIEEFHGVLQSASVIMTRVDRVSGGIEGASGQAFGLSNLLLNRFIGPAGEIAALVQGVRSGASFLFGAYRKRRAAEAARAHQGGNHNE